MTLTNSSDDSKTQVVSTVQGFLKRVKKQDKKIDLDASLYAEGLGLDSLETAELSAVLEDELGHDPFSEGGELPETVGEIVSYYDDAPGS